MYPSKYINVDLKDTPSSYEGAIAPKMYDIIKHHHAEKRVLVTSFHKTK